MIPDWGVPKYYTKMSTEIFNIINQLGQGKLTPEEAITHPAHINSAPFIQFYHIIPYKKEK